MIHEMASWRNPRIFITLLLVFLCGATAGALTMRYGLHERIHRGLDWRDGGKEAFLSKYRTELNLTPQQESQIAAVLDDFLMYYRDLESQMDDVRANGKARIMTILNPDQKQKFDKILTDLQTSRASR